MRVNKNNKSHNIKLTGVEVIRLVVWLIIISILFLLKYIFPTNQVVMTYFKGFYSFLSIILFILIVWRVEVIISKKKRKKRTL